MLLREGGADPRYVERSWLRRRAGFRCDAELGQCRAALEACVAGASGAAILVRSEPGIGKTRLVEELQAMAAASAMARHAGFILDFGAERGHGAIRSIVGGLVDSSPMRRRRPSPARSRALS
jgi:hypothetical protein